MFVVEVDVTVIGRRVAHARFGEAAVTAVVESAAIVVEPHAHEPVGDAGDDGENRRLIGVCLRRVIVTLSK